MKMTNDLNEFNCHLAEDLLPLFSHEVQALQSEDGTLRFRGPIQGMSDPTHIGTHVTITLEPDVYLALSDAAPADRAELIDILVLALASQVRAKYDPAAVGPYSLQIVGTKTLLQA